MTDLHIEVRWLLHFDTLPLNQFCLFLCPGRIGARAGQGAVPVLFLGARVAPCPFVLLNLFFIFLHILFM